MKRYTFLILVLLCGATSHAQTELNIGYFFENYNVSSPAFEKIELKGKVLEEYNLTLFKSLTTKDSRIFGKIEEAVKKDIKNAADKECGYIGDRLYYAFCMLPERTNGKYRYIFFRNSSLRSDEPNELTIIYMEGYISLKELKNIFK